MDRIGTPTGVMTMVRLSAGLVGEIERQEQRDDARGFEREPEPEPEPVYIPRPRPAEPTPVRVPRPRPATGGASWR
ncbi:hypothetical protein [Streptomyces sp. NPDC048623]|uniref:hypothetical protein n=1 Tax=Streptomyces sp. NPDC048623 TaxID=3155761 RepID=UPI003449B6B2